MALADYLNIDLSHQSPIAQDLFARVEREGQRGSLNLTGDGDAGALSANLTPEMSSWLGTHIAHRRQVALTDIEAVARRIRGGGNVEGVVHEIEEDKLRREYASRRADLRRQFYDRHRERIESLGRLQDDYDGMREAEGGRDAVVPSRLIEFGVPLLVAIPEGFMNFASFAALTGLGIAGLGMTIVVGLGIGIAAWLAGRFLKAWQFYMRADDDDQQQRGIRMISLSSALLTVSLAVAGYARYRTVAEKALKQILLGLDPPNPVSSTALLLTGNLLVFFVGAAITYIIHDENPLFAARYAKLNEAQEKFDGIERRELTAKLEEASRGHKQKIDALHKRTRSMATQPDYAAVKEDMGRLESKDHEVIGLLQSYRGHLVCALEDRNPPFVFNATLAERQSGHGGSMIGLSDFAAQELRLYRGSR